MELKSVFINIRPFEKDKANGVLKVLKLTISDIQIENISFNNFIDKIILSFRYNPKYTKTIAEKFVLNDFTILSPDEELQKAIEEVKKQTHSKSPKDFDDFEGLPDDKIEKPKIRPIEIMVKQGDYEGLLKLQSEVRIDSKLRADAELKLDTAISNAIKINYSAGLENRINAHIYISKLVAIATHSDLNYMHKDKLMGEAGSFAVNLAAAHQESHYKLVDIYNNLIIDKKLALRAVLVFAARVLSDDKSNTKAITYAIQQTNVGNLRNLFERYRNNIDKNDYKVFQQLIEFVTKRKY